MQAPKEPRKRTSFALLPVVLRKLAAIANAERRSMAGMLEELVHRSYDEKQHGPLPD